MKVEQHILTTASDWSLRSAALGDAAQLVLIFGSPARLEESVRLAEIRASYPHAYLLGCSTAGEISGTRVLEESLVVTAVAFERTRLRGGCVPLDGDSTSLECGQQLAEQLLGAELVHVLVLSDGIRVNGSELVRGMRSRLPPQVQVTGGLSGDGDRFQRTLVLSGGSPQAGRISAVGFYGSCLKVGYGSMGGWDPFGPERLVTRARGNVLYELDGQPALELYKKYLGEHAARLPSSGLLFPLAVWTDNSREEIVRTVLAVNEQEQSLTFAGDVPQDAHARLMKANFDRLVDGAQGAAKASYESLGTTTPELAVLVSCVGRKMVLRQRTEEELEAVQEVLGARTVMTGFYSYGEICPTASNANCELHNQTMTITTFSER
ncbi:MAG: FIST C-terminal domain-containing protein [Candidatus Omnitrophica bacterium]|nr:FIST C-terminal domain-containing protein [Candidatus Omnitrophota bacterium]